MLDLEFTLDPTRMVAVPADLGQDDSARVSWAAAAAETLGQMQDLAAERITSIAAALQVIARVSAADPGSSTVVVYDPITMAIAPVRLSVFESEPSFEEQVRFLRPGAPLSGQLRLTPPTVLGVGCSSAFPTESQGIAEMRWLFVVAGLALAVIVSPVSQAAALSIGVTVEDLLTAMTVSQAELSPSALFDPEALVTIDAAAQPSWQA